MSGVSQILWVAGPAAAAVAIAVAAALALVGGSVLLSLRTQRTIPAPLWLLPALAIYGIGWTGIVLNGLGARRRVGELPLEEVPDAVVTALVAGLGLDGLTWLACGTVLLLTAWAAAATNRFAGGEKRTTALHGLPGLVVAGIGVMAGAAAAVVLGRALIATVVLGVTVLAGQAALVVASSVLPRRRRAARQAAGRRALVAGAAFLAVVAMGLATAELGWVIRFAGEAAPTVADRGDAVHGAGVAVWSTAAATVIASLLAWIASSPALLRSGRLLARPGALVSGGVVAAAVVGVAGLRASLVSPFQLASEALTVGALGRQPGVQILTVARPRTLRGRAEQVDAAVGSCLVTETPTGWAAEALFPFIDPQALVDRAFAQATDAPDIERRAACRRELAPLIEPLSNFERPLVALGSSRLAPALTGHRWFLHHGELRVLLGPESEWAASQPPAVRAQLWRSVRFHWEMPPDTEPAVQPPDEPPAWDYEYASQLPVTLLEGRDAVLVAGGSRELLAAGEEGANRLRDALLSQDRRDLVLVPRRNWTVQDLVLFCLTAQAEVEEARCVLRPENTEAWSARTGLPLPWENEPPPEEGGEPE